MAVRRVRGFWYIGLYSNWKLGDYIMSVVYITVRQIETETVMANLEFTGDTWMDALDNAYTWLKVNRIESNCYHVWC